MSKVSLPTGLEAILLRFGTNCRSTGEFTNEWLVICAMRCDIIAVRYASLMRIAALLGRFLPRLGAVQSFWMALFFCPRFELLRSHSIAAGPARQFLDDHAD